MWIYSIVAFLNWEVLFSPVRGQYIWIGVITRKNQSLFVCVFCFCRNKDYWSWYYIGVWIRRPQTGCVYVCVCVSAILLEQNIRKGQILILFKSIDFFNKSIKRVLSLWKNSFFSLPLCITVCFLEDMILAL